MIAIVCAAMSTNGEIVLIKAVHGVTVGCIDQMMSFVSVEQH